MAEGGSCPPSVESLLLIDYLGMQQSLLGQHEAFSGLQHGFFAVLAAQL